MLRYLDNHHFLNLMRDSGLVEVLIRSLCEGNSDALHLLMVIQPACNDYNSDIKFSDFSDNDYKVIMDEEAKTFGLKDSILLRYMPVPII